MTGHGLTDLHFIPQGLLRLTVPLAIGSSSKDDATATTKTEQNDLIGWMRKNNRAARAARTWVHFFDEVCQMTTWNFQIEGFNDNVNTQQKSFVLHIYFNGAFTSSFAACSVNNKGREEEATIKK